MKLFLHELLPASISRAIFVDTDALFLHDPAALWRMLREMPKDAAVMLPLHPDQRAPEWHDANKICSCVLLLDLAALRARTLMDSAHYRAAGRAALSPPAFAHMFGAPVDGKGYEGVKLGDQGYWWALVHGVPGLAAPLDYAWEVSSCLLDMYGLSNAPGDDARDDDDVRPEMLHLGGTPWAGQVPAPRLLHLYAPSSSLPFPSLTDCEAVIAWTARTCTGSGPAGTPPRGTGSTSRSAGGTPSCTTSASSGRG
jgi:hypothetical protein